MNKAFEGKYRRHNRRSNDVHIRFAWFVLGGMWGIAVVIVTINILSL